MFTRGTRSSIHTVKPTFSYECQPAAPCSSTTSTKSMKPSTAALATAAAATAARATAAAATAALATAAAATAALATAAAATATLPSGCFAKGGLGRFASTSSTSPRTLGGQLELPADASLGLDLGSIGLPGPESSKASLSGCSAGLGAARSLGTMSSAGPGSGGPPEPTGLADSCPSFGGAPPGRTCGLGLAGSGRATSFELPHGSPDPSSTGLHVYVCARACMHGCTHACMCTRGCTGTRACVRACACLQVCVCVRARASMRACACARANVPSSSGEQQVGAQLAWRGGALQRERGAGRGVGHGGA